MIKTSLFVFTFIVFCISYTNSAPTRIKGISSGILKVGASSILHTWRSTKFININHPNSCWAAKNTVDEQYLIVSSPEVKNFTAIELQGCWGDSGVDQEYITSVYIDYSLDGVNYIPWRNERLNNEYYLQFYPTNANSVSFQYIYPHITARSIKITPRTWVGHISTRLEVYYDTIPRIQTGVVISPSRNASFGSGLRTDKVYHEYWYPLPCDNPQVELSLYLIDQENRYEGASKFKLYAKESTKFGFNAYFDVWGFVDYNNVYAAFVSTLTSSAYNPDRTSDFIALDNQPFYWRASHDNLNQWVVAGSSEIKNYTRIAARPGYHKIFNSSYYEMECVSKIKILHSMDGILFDEYKDINNNGEFFITCSNVDVVTTLVFNPPITARTIKIVPLQWNTHISMRLEVWFQSIPNQQIGYFISPAVNSSTDYPGQQYSDKVWVNYPFAQPCKLPMVQIFFKTASLDFSILTNNIALGGFRADKIFNTSTSHGFGAEFIKFYFSYLKEATATYISYCEY
eukprot:gene4634-5788_t